MPFIVLGPASHDTLTGVSSADHHTAVVAGDLNLADLAERLHASLASVGATDHMAMADQAAMEAETDEDTAVPPDLVRNSPGVAKVWVHWEQTGAHGILASYNMTSVTDGGAGGDTDHLWDTDFSGTAYAVIGSSESGAGIERTVAVDAGTQAATGVTTITFNTLGQEVDAISYLAAFGDQ